MLVVSACDNPCHIHFGGVAFREELCHDGRNAGVQCLLVVVAEGLEKGGKCHFDGDFLFV